MFYISSLLDAIQQVGADVQTEHLIDKQGLIFAALVLVFSFLLFLSDTNELMGSLAAALMAAGLAWVSYVIIRWLIMAMRK